MTKVRTIVLLGNKGNTTLDSFGCYLQREGRPFLRAHAQSEVCYTIGAHGVEPTLGMSAGDVRLEG